MSSWLMCRLVIVRIEFLIGLSNETKIRAERENQKHCCELSAMRNFQKKNLEKQKTKLNSKNTFVI